MLVGWIKKLVIRDENSILRNIPVRRSANAFISFENALEGLRKLFDALKNFSNPTQCWYHFKRKIELK